MDKNQLTGADIHPYHFRPAQAHDGSIQVFSYQKVPAPSQEYSYPGCWSL